MLPPEVRESLLKFCSFEACEETALLQFRLQISGLQADPCQSDFMGPLEEELDLTNAHLSSLETVPLAAGLTVCTDTTAAGLSSLVISE